MEDPPCAVPFGQHVRAAAMSGAVLTGDQPCPGEAVAAYCQVGGDGCPFEVVDLVDLVVDRRERPLDRGGDVA
jgi:hypothetical protein